MTMVPGRGKPLTQETSESRKFAPLMLFDCRGYELVDYVFADGWKAVSVSFLSSHITSTSSQAHRYQLQFKRRILSNASFGSSLVTWHISNL